MNIKLALGNSAHRVSMEISDSVWFVSSLPQTQPWFFVIKIVKCVVAFLERAQG